MSVVDHPHDLANRDGSRRGALIHAPGATGGAGGTGRNAITPLPSRRTRETRNPDAEAGVPTWAWLGLVLLATTITYGSCVTHKFLLDDFWHLDKAYHTQAKDLWRPWEYSGDDYRGYWFSASRVHGMHEPGFFRPLVTVVYYAGLHLWGGQAGPFHAINVLAHLASTATLFWLALRIFRSSWVAALTAGLYGVHPSHYETVQWIAANADALVTMFGLLSIACFLEAILRRPEGRKYAALSLAAFVLALGSKEMAVTIPAVLLGIEVWDWTVENRHNRQWQGLLRPGRQAWTNLLYRSRRHLPFWGLLAVYLAWRIPAAVGLMALKQGSNYAVGMSAPLALPTMVLNFTFYVLHFLLLYPIFPVQFSEVFGAHCWWLAGLSVAGIALLTFWLPRVAGPAARPCRLALWWIGVTLLPFCFLTPGQRIVHFPSAGFALVAGALAVGVAHRLRHRPVALRWARGGAVALLGLYAFASFTYIHTLGYVTSVVDQSQASLESHLKDAPPGAQVYLINLWQPAWMFEHLIDVRRPGSNYDIQILSFDPVILPPDMRAKPNLMARWFVYCFPEEARPSRIDLHWATPRTLTLTNDHNVFFRGIVEEAMPVAAEAGVLHKVIQAGAFTGEATAANDRGPTQLTFQFRDDPRCPARIFLRWDGQRWERLEPPAGWDRPAALTLR